MNVIHIHRCDQDHGFKSRESAMNKVTSDSVKSMCRVCLARGDHTKRVDLDGEDDTMPEFSEFFATLTTLGQDDKLPNRICKNCTGRVLDAYQVRKLAQSSDHILRFIANLPEHSKNKNGFVEPDVNENIIQESESNANDNTKKYVCPKCAKSFPYKSELQRHKETHEPHYRCATCEKVFGFKSSLRRHERQHQRAGHVPCPHCSSLFRDEALLKRHMQYAHQGKKYVCVVCVAEYGSASALRIHRERHTARGQRALQCRHPGCNKAFSLRHQLTRHEATHTGVKKFYCDDCGKGFVQAHHLVSHVAVHRPEQRIPCTVANCGKSFPTKYALSRHRIVHEKELACRKCNQVLLTTRSLRAHEQRCSAQQRTPHTAADDQENPVGDRCSPKYVEKFQKGCYKNSSEHPNPSTTQNFNVSSNTDINMEHKETNSETPIETTLKTCIRASTQDIVKEIANQSHTNNHKYCEDKNEVNTNPNPRENVQLRKEERLYEGLEVTVQQSQYTSNPKSCCSRKLSTNIEDVLPSTDCSGCCQISDGTQLVTPTNNWPTSQAHTQNITSNARGVEMQGNDCKGFLGNCIVGNGLDVANEECICAKVKYEVPVPEYLTTPLLAALEQQGYYPH